MLPATVLRFGLSSPDRDNDCLTQAGFVRHAGQKKTPLEQTRGVKGGEEKMKFIFPLILQHACHPGAENDNTLFLYLFPRFAYSSLTMTPW
jgi:hypothetical protein